jgi:hypothetical protein
MITKTKKIKSEPLFDKGQLKLMKERISYYERVLSTNFLDEMLSIVITKRMLLNYLDKKGIDVNEISKEYAKEIDSIYMAVIPERYKEQKKNKVIVRVVKKGKYVKTKKAKKTK